jgi:hypothetical protein
MLQQVYIDSRYADFSYQTGSQAFWLSDPLTKPEGFYFKVHVLSVWIPMTYYNVFSENNRLDIEYNPGDSQTIIFPEGNRDIDFLVSFLNLNLRYGYEAIYDPSTNKISFSTFDSNPQNEHLVFLPTSTCEHLLGFQTGNLNTLPFTCQFGVDMTRTSSIMIRTNLHGTNRDPYTRRMSDILCKIPVSHQQPNELIEYSQPAFIRVTNQMINHFTIGLFDDDGRYLNLNGNRYTLTLQISIERDENHIPDLPRFLPPLQSNNINNEPVGNSTGVTKSKPKNEVSGGPNGSE